MSAKHNHPPITPVRAFNRPSDEPVNINPPIMRVIQPVQKPIEVKAYHVEDNKNEPKRDRIMSSDHFSRDIKIDIAARYFAAGNKDIEAAKRRFGITSEDALEARNLATKLIRRRS